LKKFGSTIILHQYKLRYIIRLCFESGFLFASGFFSDLSQNVIVTRVDGDNPDRQLLISTSGCDRFPEITPDICPAKALNL
jgi:hypothetical protein